MTTQPNGTAPANAAPAAASEAAASTANAQGTGANKETTAAPAAKADDKAAPAAPAAEPPKADAEAAPAAKVEEKKEEPAKPVVPEKYELKPEKDSPISAARLEEIAAEAKADGLSNEQAQKLLAREEAAVMRDRSAERAAYLERSSKWPDEIKAHPKFGGENSARTAEAVKRLIDVHGTPGFKKICEETGLGNHPELVFTLASIGERGLDDSMVAGSASGSSNTERAADVLFGEVRK